MGAPEKPPQLSIEALSLIEKKIEVGTVEPEDLEELDRFLSNIGVVEKDYILKQLKKYDIYSYEEYILEKKKDYPFKRRVVDGVLNGSIQGVISFLKTYLKKL